MYKSADVPLYLRGKNGFVHSAKRIGFGNKKGKIQIGYDADLVLFNDEINIKAVMTDGEFRRNEV
ncbi:MAG: amidohydrolase family protein [Acutalibacteraceae bacterium]